MNQRVEFRSLLLEILNELSNDARCSFLFVLGDTIPRMQRENTTFFGTLTAIESLFERAKISLDDCDYLIYAFKEIRCYDAANQYQKSQRSITTIQCELADIYNDNDEDDKITLHKKETTDKSSLVLQVDKNQTSRNRTQTLIIKSASIINRRRIHKECFQTLSSKLILSSIIQLSYSTNDVYELNETWFYHSANLSLTYTDRLLSIHAHSNRQTRSISITFIYSSTKQITHQLPYSINNTFKQSLSINFTSNKQYKIHQDYEQINNTRKIIGLNITLDDNQYIIGQCDKSMYSNAVSSEYNLGFVSARLTNFNSIEKFQFVWYRNCSTKIRVIDCLPFKYI